MYIYMCTYIKRDIYMYIIIYTYIDMRPRITNVRHHLSSFYCVAHASLGDLNGIHGQESRIAGEALRIAR